MGVVSVPYNDPWKVNRSAWRELMERLEFAADTQEDAYAARRAAALDGLHFHLLERTQAQRIARRLSLVADEWRFEIQHLDDEFHQRRAERLAQLEMILHDVFDDDPDSAPISPRDDTEGQSEGQT